MSQQNVNTTASESKESSSQKPKIQRRPAKAKADKTAMAAVEQALEKIDIEMIPLSRLAVSPLNVRSKVYVQSRIESLAATIKNVGLLHNLIAHDMADGMLGVACGGRRLTALQLLLSQGVYQPDQLIPVKRVTDSPTALPLRSPATPGRPFWARRFQAVLMKSPSGLNSATGRLLMLSTYSRGQNLPYTLPESWRSTTKIRAAGCVTTSPCRAKTAALADWTEENDHGYYCKIRDFHDYCSQRACRLLY
jgi:hypothetical protein